MHISELAPYRVRQTTDVVKEGDEVTVKIIAVDPMGKIKLSASRPSRRKRWRPRWLSPRWAATTRAATSFREAGVVRASTAATSTGITAAVRARRSPRPAQMLKSESRRSRTARRKAAPFYLSRTSTFTHQEGCGGRG